MKLKIEKPPLKGGSEKMEICPKCDLEYAKKGESAVGRLLCLCDSKIDISGPFPILKEKQNQPDNNTTYNNNIKPIYIAKAKAAIEKGE